MKPETPSPTPAASHVIPIRVYLTIAALLLALTALTVCVSFLPLHGFRVVVAVGIATVKASLVALYFMHLRYDDRFNAVVFVGAIVFVIVFFAFTLIDPLSRGRIDRVDRSFIRPEMPRAGALLTPTPPSVPTDADRPTSGATNISQ